MSEFHLGAELGLEDGSELDRELRYDPDDLTTHGVILGMTGSGKTGLGTVLLEEALSTGVPALILDPKGDMPNLLLNFPDFRPDSFRPWVSETDAEREGQSADAYAAGQAKLWRTGTAGSGVTPERMRGLTGGVEFTVYTPGSSAGTPLNIIGDLRAPSAPGGTPADAETIREEAAALVGGILSLIDVDADPLASREHILLANLVEAAWAAGRDLDLPTLITQVMDPPMRKLGVFEVDTFFPPADRRALAMRLNGLVASPAFAAWTEGAPLDMRALLYAPDGGPRAAILYLAHLGEAERQFVVSLVLSKLITWMRQQPGTGNLRALCYMDEVVGFIPPSAEPPAKRPLLTLLKQARAYGVGVVLSTQNPVDLDYKAMSNAGTWMIGRLQTERDKARVLEALRSAAGDIDIDAVDRAISGLDSRQFVLHNTHDRGGPRRFATRWAMSYLAGPLTRQQLAALPSHTIPEATAADGAGGTAAGQDAAQNAASTASATGAAAATAAAAAATVELADDESAIAPEVAAGVRVSYVDPAAPWIELLAVAQPGAAPPRAQDAASGDRPVRLLPMLTARVHLRYDERRAGLDHREEWEAVLPLDGEERIDPERALHVDLDPRDFRADPPPGAVYRIPRAAVGTKGFFGDAERALRAWLQREQEITLFVNPELKLYGRVGEDEAAFAERCRRRAAEEADREAAKLRDSFTRKIDRVHDQIARAQDRVEQYEADTKTRRSHELISAAGDVLGAFLGGRKSAGSIAGRIGRSSRGASSRRGQTTRTEQRLRNARDEVERRSDDLDELEDDLREDLADLVEHWDEIAGEIETLTVGLERDDVDIDEVALAWLPVGR